MERNGRMRTKSSFSSLYLCNTRFYVFLVVCIFLIIGGIYFFSGSQNDGNSKPAHHKPLNLKPSKWNSNEEIEIFREYLQIPTVHPDIDFEPCIEFLKKQAANLKLTFAVHSFVDKNPVVMITWEGSEPELESVVLNSHMDVVPVYEEYWSHPPFAADVDDNDDIFARGAQDMKSVGMQYLAAIRALKRKGINQLKRTVYIVYMPDEELGGMLGMDPFSKSDTFKAMNVAFVLDEGGVAVDDEGSLPVFYAERTPWEIEFVFHGHSGHGSILYNDTPGEKLAYVVHKLTEYRKEEMRKLNELKYPYGNVTSINLTILKGGIETNVIPAEMSATFDIRISVNTDLDEFERMINRWCDEAGANITIKTPEKGGKERITPVDNSNPFWIALKNATDESGIKVKPMILGPSSDMKYIRRLNISAFGFSPLIDTKPKLHDHNEYLNANIYLKGIQIYEKIIFNLGNA